MTREKALEILEHNWTGISNPDYTEKELCEVLDIAIQILKATQSVSEKCKGCVEFTECADLLNMPLGHSREDCISRTELLARIDAERKHLLDIKMDGAEHIIVHHARRIIEDMPPVSPEGENFTDEEKRMFLTSLARERKICEQVDIEYPNAKIKLVPIIHSIKKKVLNSSLWKEDEGNAE